MVAPLKITPELQENLRRRYEDGEEPVAALAVDAGCTPRNFHKLVARWGWRKRTDRPPRDLPDVLQLEVEADDAVRALRHGADGDVEARHASPLPTDDSARSVGAGLRPAPTRYGEEDAEAGISSTSTGHGEDVFVGAGLRPAPTPDGEQAEPPNESAPAELPVAERLEREVERQLGEVQNLRTRLGPQALTPADAERTARALASLTETLFKVRRLRTADAPATDCHDDDDMPRDIDAFREALARRIEAFVRSRTDEPLPEPGAPAG